MKTLLKIIGSLIAFVLCVAMLAVEITTHFTFWSTESLSSNNLNRIVEKTDFTLLLEDNDGNKTELYRTLQRSVKSLKLTDDAIDKILESEGFKNILKGVLGNASQSVIFDKRNEILTVEETKTLINNNIDNIIANSGVNLSVQEKAVLEKAINDNIGQLVNQIPTVQELTSDNTTFAYVAKAFSLTTKLILLGAIVLLTLLIALFKWSFGKALRDAGIVTLLAGILILLIGAGITIGFSALATNVTSIVSYVDFLKPVAVNLGIVFLINGAISLVVSIIALVIASNINEKEETRKDKGTILGE